MSAGCCFLSVLIALAAVREKFLWGLSVGCFCAMSYRGIRGVCHRRSFAEPLDDPLIEVVCLCLTGPPAARPADSHPELQARQAGRSALHGLICVAMDQK